MPEIPAEYSAAMDERYRESERRMRELAGKQQALQSRALRSQGAQRGFTGARNAGAEMSVLDSIGAQTSAEVIQKSRELESQRLGEMQKWMEGERGYEQELGKMKAGYGYQSRLAKDKDDRAAQLMREGWDRSDANAQAERELKQTMQQASFGQEQTMQEMIADLEREGWTAEEARNEAQRQWESGESALGRTHDVSMQDMIADLEREGWTAEEARNEAQRLWQEGENTLSRGHDVTMQDMIADLQREGWSLEDAQKKAALDFQRQQEWGLGYTGQTTGSGALILGGAAGGGGGGGGGGAAGRAQQELDLERQRLEQQQSQYESQYGYTDDEGNYVGGSDAAAAAAEREWQEGQTQLEQGYYDENGEYVGGTVAAMAQVEADMGAQLEELRANQGQIAGIMQQYADYMAKKAAEGPTFPTGRFDRLTDTLNAQLKEYGSSIVLDYWRGSEETTTHKTAPPYRGDYGTEEEYQAALAVWTASEGK